MVPWSGQSLVNSLWDALSAPFQAWLAQHPLLFWLASHPVWLIAVSLVMLLLLAGLLRAMAGLTEQLWLALLRLPIWLVQWIWRAVFLLLRPVLSKAEPPSSSAPTASRLSELLVRLERLRQEEQELMQVIKSLLSAQAKQEQNH
jgi:hypothetical protein